ncbi:MAG TPA: hypothetical protein VEN82_01700, partial [Actinomycetota bacterium]|nr:hypothetical protein [Actinomycetota bacterium]
MSVPNELGSAGDPRQAELDSVDLEVILAGFGVTGVRSGGVVTAQGAPNMSVAVSAGTILVGGAVVALGANANVAIAAADPANGRFDLVTANGQGNVAVVPGVAAPRPVFPLIPASSAVLAAVFVPAAAAAISPWQIVDKRVTFGVQVPTVLATLGAEVAVTNSAAETTVLNFTLPGGWAKLPGAMMRVVATGNVDTPGA